MKITLKKIEQGVCPYCGSMDINYDAIELKDEMLYYPAHCCDCGRSFEEWYDLVFAGHNVGDNCYLETHPGDKNIEIEVAD